MSNSIGKKYVAPTPQSADPATVFTHVRDQIWRDGHGKLHTSEHGSKHPPNWRPTYVAPPPFVRRGYEEDDEYTGYYVTGCGV